MSTSAKGPAAATAREGSCHCGKVRYRVDAAIDSVITCNCSMCWRSGTMLAFLPAASFTLLSGEGELRDYQFNKHVIHHLFCTTCGIKPFARGTNPDGTPMVAVNVRTLEDFDATGVPVHTFDGKSA